MTVDDNQNLMDVWDLFSRVANAFRKSLEFELISIGLKRSELKVLRILSDRREMPINAIAEETDLTGPWITGVVNDLVHKGYVKKTRNKNDRRMIKVSITHKGINAVGKGSKIKNRILESCLSSIEPGDISTFRRVLASVEKGFSSPYATANAEED